MDETVQMLILFIASVMAAMGFIAVAQFIIGDMGQKVEAKTQEADRILAAGLSVVHAYNDSSNIYLFISNTDAANLGGNGSSLIDMLFVSIDGNISKCDSISGINSNGNQKWEPHEIYRCGRSGTLSAGYHDAYVFYEDIRSPEYTFKVE